jgi:II/X family phage/plasmid replication protein
MKAYCKGLELKAHPLAASVPQSDQLEAYAEGLVRQEVTIRSMELKRRGLDLLRNWAILGITPRGLFEELAGQLTISEATMRDPADMAELPPKLRSVYQLWHDGHDLREIFPARMTFYRHRKALLAYGIDIAVKRPREVSNVVPLVVTLVGREVGVPDWARGTPLYFDPAARRAA